MAQNEPIASSTTPQQQTPPLEDTNQILIIGGQSGSGKTSCAFELHDLLAIDDIKHAVIEGDNLDMAHPAPWAHGLAEKNLAAMWANYRELGYRKLVYTNTDAPLHVKDLCEALGGETRAFVVVLSASQPTLRRRLEARESLEQVEPHIRRSEEAAGRLLEQAPAETYRIDTGDKTAREVAAEVRRVIGW